MSFGRDIQQFANKAKISTDQAVRAINLQLLSSVVLKMPVDTGETRAGTFTSIGQPSFETSGSGDAIANGIGDVNRSAGNIFYITNNKPWIRKLEFGGYGDGPKTTGGFSKQAPRGMFRISVMEVKNGLRDILR